MTKLTRSISMEISQWLEVEKQASVANTTVSRYVARMVKEHFILQSGYSDPISPFGPIIPTEAELRTAEIIAGRVDNPDVARGIYALHRGRAPERFENDAVYKQSVLETYEKVKETLQNPVAHS